MAHSLESKRFVGSIVHVILTRQSYGQRSSMSVERKRWALEIHFSVRICHVFPTSKCRGEQEPGLCIFWVLVYGEPLRIGDFRKKKRVWPHGKSESAIWLHGKLESVRPLGLCTQRLWVSSTFLIRGIFTKFAWKNSFLALSVCFAQTCSSAGRMFAASRSRSNYHQLRFHNIEFDEIPCKLDSTRNLSSFEKYPTPP